MNNFGKRIKAERLRLGLSQSAFAKAGSISQATQTAYESDSRTPDLAYISLLMENVGLDQYFVLTGNRLKTEISKQFDWDLTLEILATIEFWADSKDVEIPVEKKVDLLRILYGQFSETGKVDAPTMQAALRLVA